MGEAHVAGRHRGNESVVTQWPRVSDKVFVAALPFRGGWIANRTDERLFRMIKGFHEAGDVLVSESEGEPRRAQNLI